MPTGQDFVNEASSFIGTPYVWGGANPRGFDCSGLVEYSLSRLGLRKVPRTSEAQYRWATPVAASDVQPGDLVFMNFPGEQSPGHVAIFAGSNGRGPNRRSSVIQAPKPGGDVQRVPFTPLPAGSSEWGGRIVGYGRVPGLDYQALTLESLWLHAGGPPKVAKTMAAIALAESGGRVGARGGPNSDGSYDYGLWQINSSHHYSRRRLLTDPAYNARAAVSIYRSQGLSAWSTYTDGAYRKYLSQAAAAEPVSLPPRPGPAGGNGSSGGGGGSGDAAQAASDAQAAAWGAYNAELDAGSQQGGPSVQPASFNPFRSIPGIGGFIPDIPNPLNLFNDAASAVSDVGTFLKWVAWLFSPRNILRVVEFLAGAGLMGVAAMFALRSGRTGSSSSSGPTGRRRATIRRVIRSTPAGRAYALAGARREGRTAARRSRAAQVSAGHREEEKRARKRAQRSEEARRKPGESRSKARARRRAEEGDIPF